MNHISEINESLKQLADGYSTHSRQASRYWIVLAIASLFAVTPRALSEEAQKLDLPFGLGTVTKEEFYPFSAITVSLLIIGYASNTIQVSRIRMLVEKLFKKWKESTKNEYLIHIQDIFEAITSPTITHVAPLAQIFYGKQQFFPESDNISDKRRVATYFYYVFLKIIVVFVVYALPLYALILSVKKGNLYKWNDKSWEIPNLFFWPVLLPAFLVFCELLYLEISSLKTSYRVILSRVLIKKIPNPAKND